MEHMVLALNLITLFPPTRRLVYDSLLRLGGANHVQAQ